MERILIMHPGGKTGVTVERGKYEQMKRAILACIAQHGVISAQDLVHEAGRYFEGSNEEWLGGLITTVKQDLEARGLIECVPGRSAQHLRLSRGARAR